MTVRDAIVELVRGNQGKPIDGPKRLEIAKGLIAVLARAGVDDVLPVVMQTESDQAVALLLISPVSGQPLNAYAVEMLLGRQVSTGAVN